MTRNDVSPSYAVNPFSRFYVHLGNVVFSFARNYLIVETPFLASRQMIWSQKRRFRHHDKWFDRRNAVSGITKNDLIAETPFPASRKTV
ncbi:hypothetical protein [Tannerella forsythia]|uniref:Uncharacterized protein n=1 Tax=Tannerella forsythia TaxID=28112 RepID=A0A3P1XVB9_TANFO|nr:hypothetical protein [Tannerella forsythia]RRD62435.1 hypothetical protein EII40_03580 [Tannerella forsythia]